MDNPTIHDLAMATEGMRNALMRAADAIQGCYAGTGHKGINGEAIIALAMALQERGERWDEAVTRARANYIVVTLEQHLASKKAEHGSKKGASAR